MSPSESADDAVNPLKLSLGKLTGAMAFGCSHLRGSGRVPHSAQNKGLRRRPHLGGVPKAMALLGAKKLSEVPGACFECGDAQLVAQSRK